MKLVTPFLFLLLLASGSGAYAQRGQRAQNAHNGQRTQAQDPAMGTLKPIRIIVGKDTLFAFKRTQAKDFAKTIANSEFDQKELSQNKETIRALGVKVETLSSVLMLRNREIKLLESQLAVRDSLALQYQIQHDQDKAELKKKDRQLAKQGTKYKLLGGLGLLLLLLLIIIL